MGRLQTRAETKEVIVDSKDSKESDFVITSKTEESKDEWRKKMGDVYRGVPTGPLTKKDLKPFLKHLTKYGEESSLHKIKSMVRKQKSKSFETSHVSESEMENQQDVNIEEQIENAATKALRQLKIYDERLRKFSVQP